MSSEARHTSDAGSLSGARVAILGYGEVARKRAHALRASGNDVAVGMRLGGMSWVRARGDGFPAADASTATGGADVVVVLVPDDEHASVWFHAIEPQVSPDTLLVFGRGLPLELATFVPKGIDVVFVSGELGGARSHCRVAVRHDATGRALERAIAYARAAFGPSADVGTTTIEAEVEAELAALEARAGGPRALLTEIERTASRLRDNHAPEEARLAFYDGLRAHLERRLADTSASLSVERGSATSLSSSRRSRTS